MKRKLIIAAIVIVVLFLGTGAVLGLNGYFGGGADVPEDFSTRGLVGYWNFDEGAGTTANDASGSGNDGTLTNGPTWTSGKAGNGGALDFDGTDDFVDIGAGPGTVNTVAFWVNPTTTTEYPVDLNGTAYVWIDAGTVTAQGFTSPTIYVDGVETSTVSAGSWQHVAVTTGTSLNASDLDIGRVEGVGNHEGQLDEVRIYNRALSAAEIRYLYNKGGPVAHYKFDEGSGTTAYDSAGSNDGALNNMEQADWISGQFGTALDFDGSNEFVNVPDNALLDFGDTDDMTISGWFNRDTATTDDVIVAKRNSFDTASDTGYILYLDSSGDKLIFEVSDGTDEYTITSSSSFTSTGWNHFAVVWDQDSAADSEIYINGRADSAADTGIIGNIGSLSNAVALRIAAESDGGSPFDGKLDDIRIYKHARTAGEIRLDYNAGFAARFGGSPNQDVTRGLIAHWAFEEGVGQTVGDSSDQGNDGTLGVNSSAGSDDPTWISAASLPANAFSAGGGALDFDGTDDFVNTGYAPSFSSSDSFTFSGWMNTSDTGFRNLISSRAETGAQDETIQLAINGGATCSTVGAVFFAVEDTDSSSMDTACSGINTSDGAWHHILGVFDTSNIYIYVDGVQAGSTAVTANSSGSKDFSGYPFYIGAHNNRGSATAFFLGQIDDVRIYNRALSAAEVRYLYNRGGPVAHWKFDEGSGATAFDSAGSNDGTLNNMEAADWVQGQFGTALDFDGSNEFVNVPENNVLDLVSQENITITGWFSRGSSDTDDTIVAKRNGTTSGDDGYIVYIDDLTDQLNFILGDGAPPDFASNSSSVFTDSVWHHFAVTFDNSADTGKVYIDGKEDTEAASGSIDSVQNNALALRIAAESDGGNPFHGKLDDIRIYKYVRSAAEVRLDYNAGFAAKFGGSPNKDINRGLVGYWNFDEGAGTTANDASGSGNDGTLTNGPTWTSGKAGNGGALDFDGVDDYVPVGNIGASVYAVALWMKPGKLINATQDSGFFFNFSSADDGILSGPSTGAFANEIIEVRSSGKSGWCSSSESISTDWHHLIVNWSASESKYAIYLDGIRKDNCLFQTPSVASGNQIEIGSMFRPSGSPQRFFWDGQLDEVRIYNRALSAAEIRYLYNKGGPVAHYKFDEGSGTTAFDSANTTNDGTITGATYVAGQYGTALDFDGSDDEISVTNANPIDFDVGLKTAVTFSAWVNADSDGEGDVGRIIDKGTNTYLRVSGESAGKLDLEASLDLATTNATVTASAALSTNTWHHVAMTYEDDADDEISLYVDGRLVGTSTNGSGAPASTDTNNLIIGGDSSTTGNFDGTIDDVRVYQYARSAAEVLQDYNAGLGTHFR